MQQLLLQIFRKSSNFPFPTRPIIPAFSDPLHSYLFNIQPLSSRPDHSFCFFTLLHIHVFFPAASSTSRFFAQLQQLPSHPTHPCLLTPNPYHITLPVRPHHPVSHIPILSLCKLLSLLHSFARSSKTPPNKNPPFHLPPGASALSFQRIGGCSAQKLSFLLSLVKNSPYCFRMNLIFLIRFKKAVLTLP